MTTTDQSPLSDLGLLRSSLLLLALFDVLLPVIDMLVVQGDEHGLWSVLALIIAPVMAPLLVVVVLFDYIMSRVRAADAQGDERAKFARIARINLIAIVVLLLFWVPYFVWLL